MDALAKPFLSYGVLGASVVVLSFVIVYLQRKLDKKDARIEELLDLRLQDSTKVTENVTSVLQDTAQAISVLSAKIESGKRG